MGLRVISFRFPAELIESLDDLANETHFNRSELVRFSIELLLTLSYDHKIRELLRDSHGDVEIFKKILAEILSSAIHKIRKPGEQN